jgi:hypothetical protein
MSDIQDEAYNIRCPECGAIIESTFCRYVHATLGQYAEAMEEIARLFRDRERQGVAGLERTCAEQDDEIERLKKIITELADWIDEDYQTEGWSWDAPGKLLIRRAREAAQ